MAVLDMIPFRVSLAAAFVTPMATAPVRAKAIARSLAVLPPVYSKVVATAAEPMTISVLPGAATLVPEVVCVVPNPIELATPRLVNVEILRVPPWMIV